MSEKQTRSKTKENEQVEKIMPKTIPKRHIFFLADKLLESGKDIQIEKMRHPGTDDTALFIFSKTNNEVYELHQFSQPHRSWFIDQTVSSNGKCNLVAPFDPLFFALYYLYKNCSDKAVPLDQIKDDDFPKAAEFLGNLTDDMMQKIADRKGPADLRAFRLSKEKALAWLALKTELIIKALKQENIQVSENAISANYIKEEKGENFEEDYVRYASGIIGDYIPEELKKDLLDYFNLSEVAPVIPAAKRKSISQSNDEIQSTKKIKVEANESIVSPPPQLKEKKETAKEKALKKAASGTKSIASFFKK